MAKIDDIKNKQGDTVYPRTLTEAVFDRGHNSLDAILADKLTKSVQALAWGLDATSSGIGVAIGRSATSSNGVAIGSQATASNYGSIAIGSFVGASDLYATAIGAGAKALNQGEGVLGGTGVHSTRHWEVPGNLSVAGTKNFEMPHPKPEKADTHRLRHSAVESATAGENLYRYTITSAKENDVQLIELPDYFVHLNKDVQLFVTPQGHFGNGYGELVGEQLKITCELPGEYNVLVLGTRNDNHQSVIDWEIKGIEREIGESWVGETQAFEVDEIIEVEEIKEAV